MSCLPLEQVVQPLQLARFYEMAVRIFNEMVDKMDFKTLAETADEIIFERYVWFKPLIAVVESYIKRYN